MLAAIPIGLLAGLIGAGAARADPGRIYCFVAQNVYEYKGVTNEPTEDTLVSPNGSFTDGQDWDGAYSSIDPNSGVCLGKLPPGPNDNLVIGTVSNGTTFLSTTVGGGGGAYNSLFSSGQPPGSGVTLTLDTDGSAFATFVTAEAGVVNFNGGLSAGTAINLTNVDMQNPAQYMLAGGKYSAAGAIYIEGQTTVTAPSGATLQAPEVHIDGDLELGGNLTASSFLTVGEGSVGTLNIQSGATVSSGNGFIGGFAGSSGNVTVNGSWKTTGPLYDGELGAGSMTVGAGGVVTTGDFMTVSAGTANSFLDITDGGKVTANAISGLPTDLAFALSTAAGGNATVTIEGAGSMLTVNGALNVGYAGDGVMTVSDGGAVAINGAIVRLGRLAGSVGALGLSGSGSSFTFPNGSIFQVGNAGAGSLELDQGFTLDTGTADVTIGALAGGSGTASVKDAGTSWTASGNFTIGDAGTGSLTVSDGGSLTLKGDEFNLGNAAGGKGTLQLSGAESSITFPSIGTFDIGNAGAGELDLNQGFTLDTGGAAIDLAAAAGSTGKVTVTNAGTSWTMGAELTVGDGGTGTLTVSNGGSVTFKGAQLDIGEQKGGTGQIVIEDEGSAFSFASGQTLRIGVSGRGDISLENGVKFDSGTADVTFGVTASGFGSSLVSGAEWDIGGTLTLGDQGIGGLTVSNGGTLKVSGDNVYLGRSVGGFGIISLDGSGSTLNLGDAALHVGEVGMGQLNIRNGASLDLSSQSLTLGNATTANGAINIFTGGELTVADLTVGNAGIGALDVGDGASPGTITVNGKAVVSAGAGIGSVSIQSASTATFNGPFTVAAGPGLGSVSLSGAAQATFAGGVTLAAGSGVGSLGLESGSQATINGALVLGASGVGVVTVEGGSTLTANGPVSVGQSGAASLTLDSGSTMNAPGGITLDGPQSTLTMKGGSTLSLTGDGDLVMGSGQGGVETLTVSGGGQLSIDHYIQIGTGDQATINFDNAQVTVGALVSQDANFSAHITNGSQVNITGTCGCNALLLLGGSIDLEGSSTLTAPKANIGSNDSISSLTVGSGAVARFTTTLALLYNTVIDVTGGGDILVGAPLLALPGQIAVGSGGKLSAQAILDAGPPPVLKGTLWIQPGGQVFGTMVVNGQIMNYGQQTSGDDPGTVTVNGSYTLGSTGVLIMEVGPSSYSRLIVNGPLTLNGGTLEVTSFDGAPVLPGQKYDFIQASDGITGQFSQIVTPNGLTSLSPSLVGDSLIFTAQHVAGSFAAAALTPNQRRLATAVDGAAMAMPPAFMPVIDNLSMLPTSDLPAAYDALSPEGLVAGENAAFAAEHDFDAAIVDAATPGAVAAVPMARTPGGNTVWLQGFGAIDQYGGLPAIGEVAARTSDEGVALGVDHRFGPDTAVGAAIGASQVTFAAPGRDTSGAFTGFHAAVFGSWVGGPVYAAALVSFADFEGRDNRLALAPSLGGEFSSHTHLNAIGGRFEFGGRWSAGAIELDPYAAVEGDDLMIGAFRERGGSQAQPLSIAGDNQSAGSAVASVGFRASAHLTVGPVPLVPSLDVSYGRELIDRRDLAVSFAAAPGFPFRVEGATAGRDHARLAFGATAQLSGRLQAYAQVQTDEASRTRADIGAQGGVLIAW